MAIGGRILGKPADADDAARMLALLSGRTHRVITAVAVAGPQGTRLLASTSRVRFTTLSAAAIARYVASGEPFGKAGAYAIQGTGGALVAGLEGSFTNVVGLPLAETARLLAAFGVAVSAPPAEP